MGVIFVGSHKALDKVAKVMTDNPSYKLQINGHADSEGSPKKNQELSDKRSTNAKAYLVGKGIEESRIKTKGYGDTMPLGDNTTDEGKKQNRRDDFIIE
ncbi:MAG: OmpA family protein [Bacteroidetes bacterium]|nr:OmpA family protein [Bacteroidota bacterium]